MGYSYRITELEAAIGVGQLEDMEHYMGKRRHNAAKLIEGLKQFDKYLQLPLIKKDRDHSYMTFPILIKEDAPFTREAITYYLEERMIETRHMVSILDQPYYKKLFGEHIEDKYPVAKWINHNGFYIGCHQEVDDDVIAYIISVFKDFFASINVKK